MRGEQAVKSALRCLGERRRPIPAVAMLLFVRGR
jgi:hypothetical protein